MHLQLICAGQPDRQTPPGHRCPVLPGTESRSREHRTAVVPQLSDRFDLGHHGELPQRGDDGPDRLVITDQGKRFGTCRDVRRYRTVSTNLHANQDYDDSKLVSASGGSS